MDTSEYTYGQMRWVRNYNENSDRIYDPLKIEHFLSSTFPHNDRIFTDGARSVDGKCGASIIIPSVDYITAYRINDGATIDSVELNALVHAISRIVQFDLKEPVIITDSLNTLRLFERAPPTSEPPIIQACRELVRTHSIRLTICWIPAHSGLYFNELADQLAKRATRSPSITETILPTLDDAFDSFKNLTWLTWQQSTQQTGKSYHHLFPMGRPNSLKFTPRSKDVAITRLRLHSCFLNLYLFKLGLHFNGQCEQCLTPEDVPHFLMSCSKHLALSVKLAAAFSALNSCSHSRPHSPVLKTYLTEAPFVDIIWEYITEKKLKL